MNRFAERLSSGRLIVTAECLPPRGADFDSVRAFSSSLTPDIDAVVVADNRDAIRGSALSAAVLLVREGKSVLLSMVTRDRNRIALLSDALGAAALCVEAIVCLSGHHQSAGVCVQSAAAHDLDSVQFAESMKKLILHGSGLSGKPVEPRLELQVGAAAHPFLRPLELNLLRLKKKITAGADFLLTQAVFDLEGFSEWLGSVRRSGLDGRTAIIASVLPLKSLEQARELERSRVHGPVPEKVLERIRLAGDPAAEGVALATETAVRLAGMPGVRGIHILNEGSEPGGCSAMLRIASALKGYANA